MNTPRTPSLACVTCLVVLAAWDWDFRSWPWSPSSDRKAATQAEIQKKQADAQRQEAEAKRKQAEADSLVAKAQKEKAVQDAQAAQKAAQQAQARAEQARRAADEAKLAAEEAERTKTLLKVGSLVFAAVVVAMALWVSIYFYRKRVVVRNEIRQEVILRSPAHEIIADSFVIDAKNVVHGSSQGQPPSLLILIGLLLDLHKRGATYKCFFDANTYYAFKDAQRAEDGQAYREFCRDFPDQFIEVPGGNRADDFILDFAHLHGTPIISNDRYRDYIDKYPWIEVGNQRRVSFAVHSGIVQIFPLGIQAQIPSDLPSAITALRDALKPKEPAIA